MTCKNLILPTHQNLRIMSPKSIKFLLILLLFSGLNPTSSSSSSPCPPSSCGNITNISFPFRLKSDPLSCGLKISEFELDCLNNQTVMNKNSRKYNVQEINYDESWFRLVDPGINRYNLSSCPDYSDWERSDHKDGSYFDELSSNYAINLRTKSNVAVVFIHCLSPLTASTKYVESAFCGDRNSISVFLNSSETYSYVSVAGEHFPASDLEESCAVDRVLWASAREWRNAAGGNKNYSMPSIYDGLANGFELEWDWIPCDILCIFGWIADYSANCLAAFLLGRFLLCVVLGSPVVAGFLAYKWRNRHLSMDKTIEMFLQAQYNNLTLVKYSYSEIKKMTDSFAQRLGEGAYGTVYKGRLRSGPYVAIKIMGQSTSSDQEFMSEIGTIGRIHHVNIVQLIGFCMEGTRCALVYEFLPNGSLDKFIFSPQGSDGHTLSYEKIFGIARGVARGIDYLHRGCNMQILHFDIKPHNILLDNSFNPKISDFGLAKLYPTYSSTVNLTAARGTMGYMAPEMFYNNIGGISYKADVYSFGMLLLEMAGRRKNTNPFADNESQIYFPSWAYGQFSAGKEIEIEDATEEEMKIVKKILLVALWCIQMMPSDRPTMNHVLQMLEGDSELQIPPKPSCLHGR